MELSSRVRDFWENIKLLMKTMKHSLSPDDPDSPKLFVKRLELYNSYSRTIIYLDVVLYVLIAISFVNGYYSFLSPLYTLLPPVILSFIVGLPLIFWYFFFIAPSQLRRPPTYLATAFRLEYTKQYIQSKGGILTPEDRKRISNYLSGARENIPALFKEFKTGFSELDVELSSRFSTMKKDIIGISKNIYFNPNTNFESQFSEIDRISQILRDRNFGLLETDPKHAPSMGWRHKFRAMNWTEFPKQVLTMMTYSPT